jgi:PHD/YefM family antitoxin component YafN of YafNO toxin-antitoxin module
MSFSLEVSLLHITIKHELLPIALGLRGDVIRLTSCPFFCTINNARRVPSMSESTYSISEIPEIITHLPEQFDQDLQAVTVTQDGKPIMTILPTNTYKELLETVESLLETLEVLKDEELMAAFREGVRDIEEGRIEPLDDVLKDLGWE